MGGVQAARRPDARCSPPLSSDPAFRRIRRRSPENGRWWCRGLRFGAASYRDGPFVRPSFCRTFRAGFSFSPSLDGGLPLLPLFRPRRRSSSATRAASAAMTSRCAPFCSSNVAMISRSAAASPDGALSSGSECESDGGNDIESLTHAPSRVSSADQRPDTWAVTFFLDIDNGFGACQAPRQTIIIPLNSGKFGCQRVGRGGFRAAFERNQRAEGSGVTKPAPVAEGRGVDALATQDGAHPAGI